jgi:ABC-type nitrate/sulfonate/bicarbonate transport system substrate-binding protein
MGAYMAVSVYAARRDWLVDSRETAVRFLRALLMASDVLQKDPEIGVKALAGEMGIKEGWAESIYENAPPPKMNLWTDSHYRYSLIKGAEFHRRLGYLAAFLFDERVISQKVDVRDVLDVSVIAEALKTRKTGQ